MIYPLWSNLHLSVHVFSMKRQEVVEEAQDLVHTQTNYTIRIEKPCRCAKCQTLFTKFYLLNASGLQGKYYDLCPSQQLAQDSKPMVPSSPN